MGVCPWTDIIPPELLATSCTYLDDLSEIRSFLHTTELQTSRIVRSVFLKRNFSFLRSVCERSKTKMKTTTGQQTKDNGWFHLRYCIKTWMEVNKDWRNILFDLSQQEQNRPCFKSNEKKTNPQTSSEDVQTFLSIFNNLENSVSYGLIDVTRHLIEVCHHDPNYERTVDTHESLEFNIRPLFYAMQNPDPEILKYLLDSPNVDVDYVFQNTFGCRLLHFAAADCRVSIPSLQLILDTVVNSGLVDVDCRDNDGKTPLHYVCMFLPLNAIERVRLLMNAGANFEARSNARVRDFGGGVGGSTPMDLLDETWTRKRRTLPSELRDGVMSELRKDLCLS